MIQFFAQKISQKSLKLCPNKGPVLRDSFHCMDIQTFILGGANLQIRSSVVQNVNISKELDDYK